MAEPVAVAAAYGVETVAEGAIAAGLIIRRPTMPLSARWRRINGDVSLPRSKHSMSLVKGKAYIFGGEEQANTAAGSDMHVVTLPTTDEAQADYQKFSDEPGSCPAARSGHAAVVISDRIYIFGGRDPKSQQLLEERGRVWVFDTVIRKWSYTDPMPQTPFPQARSQHAMAASDHPVPSIAAKEAGADAVAPHGSLILAGGSDSNGVLGDCWCFDVAAATWSKLPDPPGPPREDSALAFAGSRLHRFGGFDGTRHIGGQIDFLRLAKSTFDDQGGKSEVAIFAETDRWETIVAKQDEAVPAPRSGSGLHQITTGQGRNYLLAIFGKKDPGPDDKKRICEDVWTFQTQPTGNTGASLKDAAREAFGGKTGEATWAKVDIPEFSKTQGHVPSPVARTDFATAYEGSFEKMAIIIWGGLDSSGNTVGDGWMLTVD